MSVGFVLQNDNILWFRGGNLSRILVWAITKFDLNEPESERVQSAFYGLDFIANENTPDLIQKIRLTCEEILNGNTKEVDWSKVKEKFESGLISYESHVLDIDRKSARRIINFLDENHTH